MFEKLKQKLKKVVEQITKKTTEEVSVEAPTEKPVEIPPEVPTETAPEILPEIPAEVKAEAQPEVPVEVPTKAPPPPKVVPKIILPTEAPTTKPKVLPPAKPKALRRVVARIARRELTPADVEDVIWELQVGLLESDVAVPVSDKIIDRTKELLTGKKLGLTEDPKKLVEEILRQAIREVLSTEKKVNVFELIRAKRAKGEPAVFVFLGINGHGKTTTVAKFAKYIVDHGYKPILAAADTFRAAGIEQLEIHAERLGLEVVKQRRGADAAAVAFDAIAHAKAKGFDVVLIDTAGRMQTDVNLMDEMKKIVRVSKPDLKIFIGDALTGNDAVEQAATFDKAVGIDGSILCKMDADARGGAALSISQVTGKPILFLGTGQDYKDLVEFDPDFLLKALFSD